MNALAPAQHRPGELRERLDVRRALLPIGVELRIVDRRPDAVANRTARADAPATRFEVARRADVIVADAGPRVGDGQTEQRHDLIVHALPEGADADHHRTAQIALRRNL